MLLAPFADDSSGKPKRLTSNDIVEHEKHGYFISIPISEQILRNIQEVNKHDDKLPIGTVAVNGWSIECRKEFNWCALLNADGKQRQIGVEIKYLHELQNLYYCLNHKELNINIHL